MKEAKGKGLKLKEQKEIMGKRLQYSLSSARAAKPMRLIDDIVDDMAALMMIILRTSNNQIINILNICFHDF